MSGHLRPIKLDSYKPLRDWYVKISVRLSLMVLLVPVSV